jgi:hypothetical protein
VLASLVALYLLFTLLYGVTDSVARVVDTASGSVRVPTHNPIHLAIFSLLAMTSQGAPMLVGRNEAAYFLAGIETLCAIFLTGLLGFVAGNRIRH